MIKPKCPCDYECEYRSATCHKDCEAYIVWKNDLEDYNKIIQLEKDKRMKIIRSAAVYKFLDEITRKSK